MAHINSIWFHNQDIGDNLDVMTVHVTLKPAGTVQVKAKLPKPFYDAIVDIAQKAADAHESLMRAEIIGDSAAIELAKGDV